MPPSTPSGNGSSAGDAAKSSVGSRGDQRPSRQRLVAEFGVIVLGVLVALWADDWAGARGRADTERARVRALDENVQETLRALDRELLAASEAEVALRAILDVESDLSSDEFRDAVLVGFFYGSEFAAEVSVYDDLKNSGELALLSDADLRRALSQMDASLRRVSLAQADFVSVQQLRFDAYAAERMNLRVVLSHLELPGSESTESVDEFRDDPRFTNLVVFKLDLVDLMRSQFTDAQGALVNVVDQIERLAGG